MILRLLRLVLTNRRPHPSRPVQRRTTGSPRGHAAAPSPVVRQAVTGELSGKCYVIDGDTIVIQRTKIRLAGIDAPELHQPWGQKSKWAMIDICKGQIVTARLTGEQSYDRLVATCYLPDGRDIGAELIKRGLALDGGHFSAGKYRHLEPEGIRQKLMWAKTKNIADRAC